MNFKLLKKSFSKINRKRSNFLFFFIKKKFIKYILIGFSGFLIQIFLNNLILFSTKLYFEISLLISIFIAANWNFVFFNKIYFKNSQLTGKYFISGLLKYYLTSFLALFLNYILYIIFYNYLNINMFFSQLFGLSIVVILNYLIYKTFIWNSKN